MKRLGVTWVHAPGPGLKLVLALALGLVNGLSFAWPGTGQALWLLQLAALTGLAACLRPQTPVRQAALLGFAFAWTWIASATSWLYISMHTYGDLPAVVAVAAVLALSAFLALYYGAAMAAFCAWAPPSGLGRAASFAAAWTLAEWMRGTWLSGFPWAATGYAHIDGPLVGYAPWVGVYGIGALAAFAAACLSLSASLGPAPGVVGGDPGVESAPYKPRGAARWAAWLLATLRGQARASRLALLVIGLLALGWVLPGLTTVTPGTPLRVTLLQGAIAQEQKFQPQSGIPQALSWYGERIREANTSLVVAPETALPLLPQDLPEGYLDELSLALQSSGQAALVGIPLGSMSQGYTNAVMGLGPLGAPPYQYHKHHLVPFGEFIPPLFRWFTDLMHIPLGDFARGALVQPSFDWQGQRLAPNICYEDLFGEELGARFLQPALAPTIMVNFSNMGWFGNGMAIHQHLHISRMRTLEFARPMIRATNTGATALINHRGQVLKALLRNRPGVLVGEVQGQGLSAAEGWKITPYAWWVSRVGLWPLVGLALAVLLHGRWRRGWGATRLAP